MGLGGSFIFKSGVLNGISMTLGYYGTLSPEFFRMDDDEVKYSKSGKDTFSRYKVAETGSYGMHTLGQGYLEYNNGTVDVKAGRQLFESVFTASNDTKMIPNAFDGISANVKIAPKIKARVLILLRVINGITMMILQYIKDSVMLISLRQVKIRAMIFS